MKEKIAKWYRLGLWSEDKVLDAVKKGIITEDDAKEIMEG